MLAQRFVDTLFNLVLLVGIPLAVYYAYHRLRHTRGAGEVFRRAGLQIGDASYLRLAVIGLVVVAGWVWLLPPDLEVITREGTVQSRFAGRGLNLDSIATAMLYALIQTGFAEEFLFRGLIAGSLGRRLALWNANLLQASIFLAPHLLLLFVMPEHWPLLILVFAGSLFGGWLRIRSESILSPWLIHGGANLAVTLSVLARSSGG